ncbi:epimerase [Litoreibacter sp.]|nr:epimerase [Litoreibacter sp.]
MQKTVLILGSSGRFGQSAKCSFSWAGWDVRSFDRATDQLPDAAWGADLIINAWNPAYTDWAQDVPKLTAQIIDTARDTGATVLIPGNIYNYGHDMPAVITEHTPHRATNPLGRIRIEMEQAYQDAGIRTIILRAGDYIDTAPSGNWFDRIITAKAAKGRITYPGNPDIPHAWAFLPDVTDIAAALAQQMDSLDTFTDISVPGLTLTGHELVAAISRVSGRPQRLNRMSWLPVQIAKPFWSMAAPLLEMRHLWNTPHAVRSNKLGKLLPGFMPTSLEDVLAASLPKDINPDGFVRRKVCDLPRRLIPFNSCCGNAQAG